MKRLLAVLVLLGACCATPGCAVAKALGIGGSDIDSAAAAQNAANVKSIVADSEMLIVRAGDKVAPSESLAIRERNTSAVRLADTIAAPAVAK